MTGFPFARPACVACRRQAKFLQLIDILFAFDYEDDRIGFIFGARLPDNIPANVPELSIADIYVRLNALSDEKRLQILKYIANQGESCSTEIIEALELSQSAASRHLTQLTATGYLIARRIDGAKCYRLDKDRIGNTLDMIKAFLTN